MVRFQFGIHQFVLVSCKKYVSFQGFFLTLPPFYMRKVDLSPYFHKCQTVAPCIWGNLKELLENKGFTQRIMLRK